ncbi:Uncharacterized conserved protein, DUF4415 family [Trichlorobacter thiogenes]|uniref:Uncharacterized conserved protein, DUF4415 family n=1 Tax=Trichlorobacter thiogenes TaxID=115783 RepID=A0A1T4K0Q9_9BACT|nr:BrnA antitoxin family protein [Trichlorobacter thiogenes]SJZ35964.1 Uncharacterized conserved protein, DUF4415 family [Trichlorobacter thiogenes]
MGQIVSHTSEELKAMRARGESKSDWTRVKRNYDAGIEPAADEDSPDMSAALREHVATLKRGRVLGSGTKVQKTVRFDIAVFEAFKATGKGWQTRMNEALKTYLKEHPLNHV